MRATIIVDPRAAVKIGPRALRGTPIPRGVARAQWFASIEQGATGRGGVLRSLKLVLALLVVAAAVWTCQRAEREAPVVETAENLTLGAAGGEVAIDLADPASGLRNVRVTLSHAEGETLLLEREFPGDLFLGGVLNARTLSPRIEAEALEAVRGDAWLRVEVRDWSLFENGTLQEIPLSVDREAPEIEIASGLTYLRQAGSGAVTYTLSELAERDGVRVGEHFFHGFAKPGGEGLQRVALFAIPPGTDPDLPVLVIAEDAVGNLAESGWATVVKPWPLRDAHVTISPAFLARILPRFDHGDAADLAAAFDDVNTRVRAENERRVRELIAESDTQLSLDGGLQQMSGSMVTSRFGERRAYFLKGKRISEAVHLGYDLAATARAPIGAAAPGRVVHAGDLGIYGKCVLIDHGLGLTTLYGHLSSLDVKAGQRVERNQQLGRSGATGLAGGDHLHFSVLVGDVYVDPIEWWDDEWVRTHVQTALE